MNLLLQCHDHHYRIIIFLQILQDLHQPVVLRVVREPPLWSLFGSLLASFEPPANLMNITITPISDIFLFRPKFWSILDWLFSRFKLPFLTIGKMRCAARSEKRAIWLPKDGTADNVIKLTSRRIDYSKIKRTASQISQGNSGAFLPLQRSSFQLRPF